MARIIIVEDDVGQQEELQSFLLHAGHEAQAVGDGAALERCLEKFTPEIVLLDYNLPGESGAKLAARLRERFGANVGLVMVTARSSGSDRAECRRVGADDYLVKPIYLTNCWPLSPTSASVSIRMTKSTRSTKTPGCCG